MQIIAQFVTKCSPDCASYVRLTQPATVSEANSLLQEYARVCGNGLKMRLNWRGHADEVRRPDRDCDTGERKGFSRPKPGTSWNSYIQRRQRVVRIVVMLLHTLVVVKKAVKQISVTRTTSQTRSIREKVAMTTNQKSYITCLQVL